MYRKGERKIVESMASFDICPQDDEGRRKSTKELERKSVEEEVEESRKRATSKIVRLINSINKGGGDLGLAEAFMNHSYDFPLVLLNPEQGRVEYSQRELRSLSQRDFRTRLFFSAKNHNSNGVFIRTHHTDNHEHYTDLTFIRDLFKACYVNNDFTSAKATITSTLANLFALDSSSYHSFATVIASGLSNQAQETTFEINPSFVVSDRELIEARKRFVLMMDVIFWAISKKEFLIENRNCNIYRLAHYATWGQNYKRPLLPAILCFILQTLLAGFVILDTINGFQQIPRDFTSLVLLGLLSFFYNILGCYREFKHSRMVFHLYGGFGFLQMMDVVINLLMPLSLALFGFFVVLKSDDRVDGVLNVTALMFIPEIDDLFPKYLEFDQFSLVKDYLLSKSKLQFDGLMRLVEKSPADHWERASIVPNQSVISKSLRKLKVRRGMVSFYYDENDSHLGVRFSDFFITNTPEEGSKHGKGIIYTPYIIKSNSDVIGHEIDPSNYITTDCLLKEIEFKYTRCNPNTTKPRVGYLRLVKVDGTEVVIDHSADYINDGELHTLKGIFIITSIVMSSSIVRLRLCGSPTASEFLGAIKYYSLWDLTPSANKLLHKNKNLYVNIES